MTAGKVPERLRRLAGTARQLVTDIGALAGDVESIDEELYWDLRGSIGTADAVARSLEKLSEEEER